MCGLLHVIQSLHILSLKDAIKHKVRYPFNCGVLV